MAASTIAPFGHGSIENIARIIGNLYTGPELTRILVSVGMPDPLGEGQTKWKRLAASMQEKQYAQRDGRPVLAVVIAAMKPEMVWDRQGPGRGGPRRAEPGAVALGLPGARNRDHRPR